MSSEPSRAISSDPSVLPVGTRLGEFEILSLLGVGGFGIVYLAFDHALEREVAVKEYMPASLAGRTATMHVSIRSQSDAESFALGLRSFVNEARLLARFDDPSLLKVHRFWEANGTAYMAMPVMRGRTVKDVRTDMSRAPDEAWLRAILDPLLGAIEKLHAEGVYHRDIAPDNIQIEPDGHPVLLDFGAARRVLSDKSQNLTAILKPAYAPIEQYAEAGSVRQGPWTDIYALGATLHFLLLLRPPAPATARAIHDDESALTTAALPACSENFLRIVDWMLAPRPADRPQSVAALRDVLEGRAPTPIRRASAQAAPSDWDRTVIAPAAHRTQPPSTSPGFEPAVAPPPRAGTAAMPTTSAPPAPVAPAATSSADWQQPDERDADATVILPALTRFPQPAPVSGEPMGGRASTAGVAPAVGMDRFAEDSSPTIRVPPPGTASAPASARAAASAQLGATGSNRPRSKTLPVLLGLGAVVIGSAVAFGVLRKPAIQQYAGESATITAVSTTAEAAPSVVPPAASVPAPKVAESSVATVTVPSVVAPPASPVTPSTPPTASPSAAPNPSVQDGSLTKPAVAATGGAGAAVKPPAPPPPKANPTPRPAPSAVTAAPSATAAPPVPEPVKPAPEPSTAPAPVAEAPKPTATGPEAVCGSKGGVSYFICMERECLRSEQQAHADCRKWRRSARPEY